MMRVKENERVVVTSTVHIYENKNLGCISARFEALKLTAHGDTEEEALLGLKMLFNKEINSFRDRRKLVEWLDKVGATWKWQKDYPVDAIPYEDTDKVDVVPVLQAPAASLPERKGSRRELVSSSRNATMPLAA